MARRAEMSTYNRDPYLPSTWAFFYRFIIAIVRGHLTSAPRNEQKRLIKIFQVKKGAHCLLRREVAWCKKSWTKNFGRMVLDAPPLEYFFRRPPAGLLIFGSHRNPPSFHTNSPGARHKKQLEPPIPLDGMEITNYFVGQRMERLAKLAAIVLLNEKKIQDGCVDDEAILFKPPLGIQCRN